MGRLIFYILCFCFSVLLFPQESISQEDIYQKFLDYRLQNDNEYKTFSLEKDIAEGNLKKTRNSAISALELGLSEGMFSISKEKTRQGFSFNPYVNFSLPLYNNTGLKFNMPISKTGDVSTNSLNITFFSELYGVTRKQQNLLISIAQNKRDKALKKYLLAKKYIEKKLLKDIKELFTSYLDRLDKGLKEVQVNINYNTIRVQGYEEGSSKVRTSKLALLASEREVKEADFAFKTKYKRFLKSCGIEQIYSNNSNDDVSEQTEIKKLLDELLKIIPKDEVINLDVFNQDNYITIKDAKNAYKEKKLKDELSLNPVSLVGEAGFSNSKKTFNSSSSLAKDPITENSFTTGLGLKMPGAKISAGVDFPLDSKRRGDINFKFSFAINPIEILNYFIEKNNVKMQNEIEVLKLKDVIEEFDVFFSELKTKKNYVEWQKNITKEEISVYEQNKNEHEAWFNKGLISKYEALQAELEYKKAMVRCLIAQIGVNSFNIETSLLFDME